ncbi:hypothetical protein [Anaerolinea thermophila]|uniref:hypothetical protein n=1 Tax=Anaerolinea thermophila TaxID=167964 RepID=UPI00155A82EF|nr:hypothetical protein [Anaerolinea thermophila]
MSRHWIPPQGYHWKVVVDPTRTGDDPGIFYGAHFRWADIVPPGTDREAQSIPCPWPSGTVFEHIKTGERVVIRRGRVVKLEGKRGSLSDSSGVSGHSGNRGSRVHVSPR